MAIPAARVCARSRRRSAAGAVRATIFNFADPVLHMCAAAAAEADLPLKGIRRARAPASRTIPAPHVHRPAAREADASSKCANRRERDVTPGRTPRLTVEECAGHATDVNPGPCAPLD
jgi:hypothetical protein